MPEAVALIVPCHDEAERLVGPEILRLARSRPGLSLVLVDDGSTDATFDVLEELRRAAPDRIRVERLARNVGKGEAVRHGLRAALDAGAGAVGYLDADLATPPEEMARLVDVLRESGAQGVLGSRVRLLGTEIYRSPHRHYLGRIFATVASLALRLNVYDTQCGAKLFRASPSLDAALARPFRSRWIFDVELLERLVFGSRDAQPIRPGDLMEVPLREWRDVGASKLRLRAMLLSGIQLLLLLVKSRLRRRVPVASTSKEPARGVGAEEDENAHRIAADPRR